MPSFPTVTLSNGVKMPVIGLGTWQATDDSVKKAVEVALVEDHYPLIDTAAGYSNEHIIGEVLERLISEEKVKREDVFLTTKVWTTHLNPSRIEAATRESLKKLRVDKIDLLLAHMPTAFDEEMKVQEKDVTVEQIWKAMESIYDKGLVRAIGVSNWNASQIERVLKIAKVPIHNLQVELYLYWPQHELVEVCKKHNISITSYASIGSPGRVNWTLPNGEKMIWADAPNALEDPKVKELAHKYNKSPAQILLRYCLDRGVCVIPKSVTPARIHENINIFDFKLTPEDIAALETTKHRQRLFMQEFMEGHPEDAFASERK